LIVTTERGQTPLEFFVVPPTGPSVTVVTPGAGEPGQTVPVTLRGLNLTGATVSESTPDLTLQNQQPVDDETVTVEVVVAGGAAVDTNHTLTVTTGSGVANFTFRVIGAGKPFFNAARPPFGNRGTIVTVRLDGVNLGTIVAGTGIQLSGPKITESNALALDSSTAQATLDIESMASVGYRDVTVTTTGGTFTRSSGFRVNVPGQVPTITDVAPAVVTPGTTTAMVVTGSNFDGAAVLVTGPGATVANVVVDPGGTRITFDLTLAADAPAETRGVIVVTENGTARCNVATAAPEPPLDAAKLVKTGAVFTVASSAYRLFLFEFSIDDQFAPGLRTAAIHDADGTLTLDRRQTVVIEQAFREAHRGYVRVRAITPTNVVATSTGHVVRR
jgi:hypothetical protein